MVPAATTLLASALSRAVSVPLNPDLLLGSLDDLGAQAVYAEGEASFEGGVRLLPELVGYVPLSSPSASKMLVIGEQGQVGYLSPKYVSPRIPEPLFHPCSLCRELGGGSVHCRLIDDWLPGVKGVFRDRKANAVVQETVFSLRGAPESTYISVGRKDPVHCFLMDGSLKQIDLPLFDNALSAFRDYWKRQMSLAVQVDLPEPRLIHPSPAALARCFTTFVGKRPKYGLGTYAQDMHNGFPPTVLWIINACLEWGLTRRAREYLTYYFDRFVQDDGAFDYYGPAVSEYGQMLDVVARYVRYTEDAGWLALYRTKVDAIAHRLLRLHRDSLCQSPSGLSGGLLFGPAEADTYEHAHYYFSSTGWACRGLLELSRLYREYGFSSNDGYERQALMLRRTLNRAARASLVCGDPPFLPPYPGVREPFGSMTANPLASCTNYRYWPELVSSLTLDNDLADAILEFRRRRGGEFCATTRFADHLDDWPIAHQAKALLAQERVDAFLMTLYGHLALHQTQETFCAYEQVAIRGETTRTYLADYCVPAQLTVPLLVRWMLVYEEADSETLGCVGPCHGDGFAPEKGSVSAMPPRGGAPLASRWKGRRSV